MNRVEQGLEQKRFALTEPVDPFYAYLDLTSRLGAGHVFLLDAAAESHDLYNMSLVAAVPIVEVQVKDGVVSLAARVNYMEYLLEELHSHGYAALPEHTAMDTVIGGPVRQFEPDDCMAFLEVLRKTLRALYSDSALTPFAQGFLGYIGYDAVHYLEKLPKTTIDDRDLPDIRLQWHGAVAHILNDRLDVYFVRPVAGSATDALRDSSVQLNVELTAAIEAISQWAAHPPQKPDNFERVSQGERVGGPYNKPETQDLQAQEDVSQEQFQSAVRTAKRYILEGDIFQVVLSKRLRIPKRMHHYEVYEELRHLNPSPYMFMVEYPDSRLIGASPEVQFRAVQGNAEMKPIAGTSKGRGKTEAEDLALRNRLLNDEKERAEHLMLVDLCRNDLGRVSQIGSVQVEEFMVVEPYSHLFHLVSTVKSQLDREVSVFRALLSTFPAGTLSGAPKIRAMEIIDELETYRRGPYGGMIGMVDFDANANTAIIIRTVIEVGDEYFLQVGAGIVADSDPEQEWLECGHKSGALLAVLSEPEPAQ